MARFIVSHRLAGKTESQRNASFAALDEARSGLLGFSNILHESRHPGRRRTVMFVESDPREVDAKRRDMHPDIIVEPETLRRIARYCPIRNLGFDPVSAASGAAGIGATLELTLKSGDGVVAGAAVNVVLTNTRIGGSTVLNAKSDANGQLAVTYDPRTWLPCYALVHPSGGVWSYAQTYPQNNMTIQLPALPRTGPLGWWHQLLGMTKFSDQRGKGIRVGIVDTGFGPHPYLQHVESAGAFTNGTFSDAEGAVSDVGDHGTHVTGIIGCRPGDNTHDYGGIAAGADVTVARVYPGNGPGGDEGTASNGDIAAAIDALVTSHQVDVVNLSLGGPQPSEIEADAVLAALEDGVLVICAAGNNNGAPVMYPAACQGAVAVSAVGLSGTFPAASVDGLSLPQQPDHFAGSLYAASFNNIGPEVACIGPGVAIISTVPSLAGEPAYAAMSGTSMASPVVCASLAAVLSQDAAYSRMPRNSARAQYAWTKLSQGLRSLGLNSQYQGYGLVSTAP